MKFFCIVDNAQLLKNPHTFRLLRAAVERRNVEWAVVQAQIDDINALNNKATTNDIVYRLSVSSRALMAEALLCLGGPKTLYQSDQGLYSRAFLWGGTISLQRAKLPIIPTVFAVSAQDAHLNAQVEDLGGFPIIVKAAGLFCRFSL